MARVGWRPVWSVGGEHSGRQWLVDCQPIDGDHGNSVAAGKVVESVRKEQAIDRAKIRIFRAQLTGAHSTHAEVRLDSPDQVGVWVNVGTQLRRVGEIDEQHVQRLAA